MVDESIKGLCAALAILAACHKKPEALVASGSAGSGSSAPVVAVGSGGGSAVPGPSVDPGKVLDDALAKDHVAADAVKKRIVAPASAWAVIASKTNDASEVTELEVIAGRADGGVAEIRLVPPTGGKGTFDGVESLEAKDLEGDGAEEGLLVVGWTRDIRVPGSDADSFVMTTEEAKQLYVLVGHPPALRVAFTHIVSYKTNSEGMPEDNPTPYAGDEEVTYDWSIAPGKPAAIKLTRTKSEVADKDRLKGVLDPATDPLFSAGSGETVPLGLK